MKKLYIALLSLSVITLSHTIKAQLEYKDVAHIFYSRCASCHHENQAAQSMLTYSETYPWRNAILNDLQSGKMPPWAPDTLYTRFVHERAITQSEKNNIISWINSGAIKGDTTLAPAPPVFTSQYKLSGTPDVVLKIPAFTSTASTADIYDCFSIPTTIAQDMVLRAYEIVPGNPFIVHHVLVFVDTAGTSSSDLSGTCFSLPGDFGIGGWTPGADPIIFPGQAPLKAGIRIKGGAKIILQIHYPAGTSGMIDSTQIRMFFYPQGETGIRPIYNAPILQNWNLYMLPNTVTPFTDVYPNSGSLPNSLSMFASFPHSHKVCTKIVNYAYSGTDTIPLVRINKWDFQWQGYYTYPNLVKVPSGYKIFSKHVYDNTSANPDNPNNPPALVVAGTSTTNEMLFDEFMWLNYQTGDELIDVESLLANDPLLTGAKEKENTVATQIQPFIYPNPASNTASIYLSKKAEYKVRLLSITGQRILQTDSFNDRITVDLKNIPAGLYIVEVQDTQTNERAARKIIVEK